MRSRFCSFARDCGRGGREQAELGRSLHHVVSKNFARPPLKSLESGQRIEVRHWTMQCPIRVKSMKILAIV